MPELLLRPDLGKRGYRLRCRFSVGAFLDEWSLEKAKRVAAEAFVTDMAKQGWCYLDRYGFKMTGPYPAIEVVQLPKRSQQERWHLPSADIMPAVMAGARIGRIAQDGGYARSVAPLTETDRWEFELAGVFVHQTILTEYPDKHEEIQHA
jgi:hypothetical protein